MTDQIQKTKVFIISALLVTLVISGVMLGKNRDIVLFDFEDAFDTNTLLVENISANIVDNDAGKTLALEVTSSDRIPIVTLNLPERYTDLSSKRFLEMSIKNLADKAAVMTFWALSGTGWGGISSASETDSGREKLEPNSATILRIDLYGRYPGPDALATAIDPAKVKKIRIVFHLRQAGFKFEVGNIIATGSRPANTLGTSARLPVPEVINGKPGPGKRVRQKLPSYRNTNVAHVLYLPKHWLAENLYPIIVEYTGNEFYHKYCHSTGYTEQGHLAYGLSRGEGFICINMPFVSEDGQNEQTNGWGNPEKTADYCLETLRYVCENYGGDPSAVFITGFSRGDIACNFIALRNDKIADAWLAFLSNPDRKWPEGTKGWHGSEIGWNERIQRIKSRACFLQKPQLGPAHVDIQFLEDSSATLACRQWLQEVLKEKPGTHSISGSVTDRHGNPIQGVRIQSGYTHFTYTNQNGTYLLQSLTDGHRMVSASKDFYSFEPAELQVQVNGSDIERVNFIGVPK